MFRIQSFNNLTYRYCYRLHDKLRIKSLQRLKEPIISFFRPQEKSGLVYRKSSGNDFSKLSMITWIFGIVLGAFHKREDFALCAQDTYTKRQIDRIFFLTTGNSEPELQAREAVKLSTNKDVVIFLGNSKAGKSTIINLLIGNELEAIIDAKGKYLARRTDDNTPINGPRIGEKMGQAETSFPSAWNPSNQITSANKDLLVDVPGFDDTRGPAQDIANAFYINQILKKAKSVKIILVSDVNDIANDNQKNFVNLMTLVHNIFSEFPGIMNSVSIIFSKCEQKQSENIREYLKEILNNPNIDRGKELIHHFLSTPNSIGIFERPIREGLIEMHVAENIAMVLDATKFVSLAENKITPGISSDSQVFLYQSLSQFTDPNKIAPLTDSISSWCDKQLKECQDALLSKNLSNITNAINKLIKLQTEFPKPFPTNTELSEEEYLQALESIARFDAEISTNIPSAISLLKLVSFIDDLISSKGKEKWFNCINNKLSYFDLQLEQCVANLFSAKLQINRDLFEKERKEQELNNEQWISNTQKVIKKLREQNNLAKKLDRLNDLIVPGLGSLFTLIRLCNDPEDLANKIELLSEYVKQAFKYRQELDQAQNELNEELLKIEQKLHQEINVYIRKNVLTKFLSDDKIRVIKMFSQDYQRQFKEVTKAFDSKVEAILIQLKKLEKDMTNLNNGF